MDEKDIFYCHTEKVNKITCGIMASAACSTFLFVLAGKISCLPVIVLAGGAIIGILLMKNNVTPNIARTVLITLLSFSVLNGMYSIPSISACYGGLLVSLSSIYFKT